MSAAFDTLSAARDLEAAGFDRPQAEAVAKAINHGDAQAVTKADLDQLRSATKTDLDQLRSATKADLDQLRSATEAEFEQLRSATKAEFEQLRNTTKAELDQLRSTTKAELDTAVATLRAEIAKQETRLTWKALGIAGLIIAAIKLIPSAY